jgi:hypothetical protein
MIIRQLISLIAVAYCLGLLLLGCSGSKVAKQKEAFIEAQKPVIVQKMGQEKRPDWTSEKPYFEDDVGLHFTSGFMGGADYALTLRLAKSEAIKSLLEFIQVKASEEFSSAIHGQNRRDGDLGRYVTDTVAWTVENLCIGGITQDRIYYEQIFDPVSQSFKYNSWVQLGISRADYVKAKTDAAQKLLDKAIRDKDEEAKRKALELLEKLREEV